MKACQCCLVRPICVAVRLLRYFILPILPVCQKARHCWPCHHVIQMPAIRRIWIKSFRLSRARYLPASVFTGMVLMRRGVKCLAHLPMLWVCVWQQQQMRCIIFLHAGPLPMCWLVSVKSNSWTVLDIFYRVMLNVICLIVMRPNGAGDICLKRWRGQALCQIYVIFRWMICLMNILMS